jgi:hypothetical protein
MSVRAPLVRRPSMEATLNRSVESSRRAENQAIVWTTRILRTLAVLFLIVDAIGKILRLAPYVEGTAKVGYPASCLVPLGVTLLAITVLYAIPRTAVLGALLLTAYLGGAVATHVRMGQPFIVPILFGVIVWGCLYLRDPRLRALLPCDRRRADAGA